MLSLFRLQLGSLSLPTLQATAFKSRETTMLLLHFLRELSQDDAMDKDDAIRLLKSLILIEKLIMVEKRYMVAKWARDRDRA